MRCCNNPECQNAWPCQAHPEWNDGPPAKLGSAGIPVPKADAKDSLPAFETCRQQSVADSNYDSPERRRRRDLVTTVMAVVAGAPLDNLPEDCQPIVKHWLESRGGRG